MAVVIVEKLLRSMPFGRATLRPTLLNDMYWPRTLGK